MSDSTRSESQTPFWSQQRRADLDDARGQADEPVTGWEVPPLHALGAVQVDVDEVTTRSLAGLTDLRTGEPAIEPEEGRTPVVASDLAEHDLVAPVVADDETEDTDEVDGPEATFPTPEPSPEPPAPAPVPDPTPVPDPSPVPPPADPTDQWRELSWLFVDDPRAAVDAAIALVQRTVEQQVGLAGADGSGDDTEQLRRVFTRLRDLHGRLTG